MKPDWQSHIDDGVWVDGSVGWVDVTDPATGPQVAEHALADPSDVDGAVQAARRVHLSGALTAMHPIARGRMVQALGRYQQEHKDEIARILTLEQGKPLWESHFEVEGSANPEICEVCET